MNAALLAVIAAVAVACSVPVARPTAIGVRVPAGERAGVVSGRSCRWWVLGVPLGLPAIDEALADALRRGRATALVDAVVLSEHPTHGPVGRHCYVVEGTAWRESSGGPPSETRDW